MIYFQDPMTTIATLFGIVAIIVLIIGAICFIASMGKEPDGKE